MLSLHRLVQTLARDQMGWTERAVAWAQAAVKLVLPLCPTGDNYMNGTRALNFAAYENNSRYGCGTR
ncbi:MAG: hypothetical protein R3E31_04650 [Chloroflexota bacterium]